ncbi:glycine-rich RNA-binding protein 3 mitochondrial [Tripterygium wilfordii]|uniref:Glycine-rich RNA-binding protein 3 mitochondrial n=1 Tax=Tripterygium wilfordii TaxID=458696 RepID=A0A7J7CJ44_TRIWF|nr:organelle RRM domain-containing protein 6, chloroplastic [Tripterygium wilfordii]KAF5734070.1 glycine-rich RNA-binding protein 3 mitochondrial [Tripterygium wilfordii]
MAGSVCLCLKIFPNSALLRRTESQTPLTIQLTSGSGSSSSPSCISWFSGSSKANRLISLSRSRRKHGSSSYVLASSSSPSPSPSTSRSKTRLYVSGLSFRTTEESLRNAFKIFGQLVEVNLVMDSIANRPRGFAFLRYATEEESLKAIEGMHGKFLDGRVIFVEIAKRRSELHRGFGTTEDHI